MNVKFNLSGINIKVPAVEAKVNIENITYEVSDANPMEIAEAMKLMMKSIAEMKSDMESSDRMNQKFSNEETERHEQKLTDIRLKEREARKAMVAEPFGLGYRPVHKTKAEAEADKAEFEAERKEAMPTF